METLNKLANNEINDHYINKIKMDFYNLRHSIEMMEFLIEKNSFDRIASYLPEMKKAVKEVKEHIGLLQGNP